MQINMLFSGFIVTLIATRLKLLLQILQYFLQFIKIHRFCNMGIHPRIQTALYISAADTANGISTQKRLPFPSVLSPRIFPPIASVRLFVIAMSSPVPCISFVCFFIYFLFHYFSLKTKFYTYIIQ